MSKSGSDPASKPERPSPPRNVVLASVALVVAGISALGAAFSLYGLKDWLHKTAITANNKLKATDKNHKTDSQLLHQVNSTITGQVVATIVLFVALSFIAFAVYRGRYWARWTVLGLWVLSTFTGTLAGFASVVSIGTSEPIAFKVPAFLAGVFFIAAVVLTSLKPSIAYFNLSRPERPAGAPVRRGLFAPREAAPARPGAAGRRGSAVRAATTRPAGKADADAGSGQPDRSRSKQRANAEAVAKGAELARTRAKASKSRRTGV
ncbi:MAG: hypothetical protein QOH52_1647 [Pseudonocardiales bacterium]|jgi:hypothetical protein|nr:hypothetical protein [Pseudonocardiales bacterium]